MQLSESEGETGADADAASGRRSVDSSVSSGGASFSGQSGRDDPGMAADAANMAAQRHWWQKMRSRPSTPLYRTFRPSTPQNTEFARIPS